MPTSIWNRCVAFVTGTHRAASRKPRVSKVWSTEAEHLENRALLSATHHQGIAEQAPAEVDTVSRRAAPVQFPSVSGTWNVTSTGEISKNGTVTITQNGPKISCLIAIQDIEPFTLKDKFTRHAPNEITKKSPRIAVPGYSIEFRVTIHINFLSSSLNPLTFKGTVKAPFVGTVANLNGTKAQAGA